MVFLPLSLPLAIAVASTSGAVRASAAAVGEPPTASGAHGSAQDHGEGAPKAPQARFPSPQCRACCDSKGAQCSKAYMGAKPGICCSQSHTCCPVGSVCVKQGQRCALQAPPRPPAAAPGQLQPQAPRPAPQPVGRKPEPGHRGQEQALAGGSGGEKGKEAAAKEQGGLLGRGTLQMMAARLGSPSPLQVILGIVLVISLAFCCTAVFCLKELCDCLFGASGGSRVAPVYGQQQQQQQQQLLPPAGASYPPGQFPGQYQPAFPVQQFNGPYTTQAQYPARY